MNRMKTRFTTDVPEGWPLNDVWLGLFDGSKNNIGYWFDDGCHYDPGWSPWNTLLPDNPNHQCVRMDSSLLWLWDDVDCNTKLPTLVCEKTPRSKYFSIILP